MAENALHDDALWDEFHRLANMSSRELAGMLDTPPEAENLQPDTPTGQQVLDVMNKHRTDLTADDLGVMRKLVERVTTKRRRGHRERRRTSRLAAPFDVARPRPAQASVSDRSQV